MKQMTKLHKLMKTKGSIVLSWGPYGGFYWSNVYAKRLCLGWISFAYYPEEVDDILFRLTNKIQNYEDDMSYEEDGGGIGPYQEETT